MNTHSLLDQLLKTGAGVLADARGGVAGARQSGDLQKYATGAAVGGLLGLLVGTKRGRSIGGSALKLGSVAAIGALAWKAYQDYQARQGGAPTSAGASVGSAGAAAGATPARFEALPAPEMELHSRAMLKAMIAAAKSDGHVDERERSLVHAELARSTADTETQAWVDAELKRPVDPAEVAAAAATPEMAAEIYLATLLIVDETTTMERAYLDELARQLKLAPALQRDLEARAAATRG